MFANYWIGWESVLLLIIVAIGLAARFHEVHFSLNGDEIFSVELASKSFSEMISGSLQDKPHPPLHIVLLHLWMKAFGMSEVSVRALSILFSGAFLLISYRLLRLHVSSWIALGLNAILALSPIFVFYGQQARPYALIVFLSTANLLAFIRVLEKPNERTRAITWAVSCAFWVYAQYIATLFIAVQMGLALFYLRSGRLRILGYGSMGCVFILPWLIAAMGGALLSASDPLPEISWMGATIREDFIWYYVSIFGNIPGVKARWLLVALAILGMSYVQHIIVTRNVPVIHVFLFFMGIGVPVVVYLISVWGPKNLFAPRQLLGAAVAFIASIGLFIATFRKKLIVGILLTLVIWTIMALLQGLPHASMPSFRDMAENIDKEYGSTVVIVQENWVKIPFNYYRRAGSVRYWSDLTAGEKRDRFLFICRPFNCTDIESEELKSRSSLLATWRWGRLSEPPTIYNQLLLYDVRDVAKIESK